MRTEDAIGFGVGDELDHSFHVINGKRAAIGAEWKPADAHVDPLLFRLVLGETDTGELGIRVNDAGDRLVVYVACLGRDDFYAGDVSSVLLTRYHRACDHIPYRINAF